MTTDRYVYDLIHSGSSTCPVSILEIAAATRMEPRAIKAAVERLRNAGEPIAARRGKPSGYYLIRTASEAEAAARPMVLQAVAMLRTARKMLPEHRYRELVGQEVFEEEL